MAEPVKHKKRKHRVEETSIPAPSTATLPTSASTYEDAAVPKKAKKRRKDKADVSLQEPEVTEKAKKDKKEKRTRDKSHKVQDKVKEESSTVSPTDRKKHGSTTPKNLPISIEEAKQRAEETAQFFQNFQAFFDNHQFESNEERVECLESAHSHLLTLLDGHADLLNHKVIGAGVDHLIQHSTLIQIRRLFARLSGSYARLMSGGGTSRVMELLLSAVMSAHASVLEVEEGEDGAPPSLSRILCAVVEEVSADVPTLLSHKFGSFSLRTLIRVLAGMPTGPEAKTDTDRPVFIKELTTVCTQIIMAVEKSVMGACQDVPTSACLQVVIEVLGRLHSRSDEYEANPLFQGLLDAYTALQQAIFQQLEDLACHPSSSRLVESVLANIGANTFVEVYKEHVAPHMPFLLRCPHLGASFVAQAAVQATSRPDHLVAVLSSLPDDAILMALRMAKFGFLNHLLQAAHRLGACQADLVARITIALRNYLTENLPGGEKKGVHLTPLMLQHKPFQVKKSHFGYTLLQQLLAQGCKNAKEWYQDMGASLDGPALRQLAETPGGSRVVQAYVEGVEAKEVDNLASAFLGHYVALAKDVNGSYILEKLFHRCRVDQRRLIATELAAAYAQLRPLPQSLMVLKHCNIDLFRSRPEEWEQQQRQASKKDDLMVRMLGAMSRAKGPQRPKR